MSCFHCTHITLCLSLTHVNTYTRPHNSLCHAFTATACTHITLCLSHTYIHYTHAYAQNSVTRSVQHTHTQHQVSVSHTHSLQIHLCTQPCHIFTTNAHITPSLSLSPHLSPLTPLPSSLSLLTPSCTHSLQTHTHNHISTTNTLDMYIK